MPANALDHRLRGAKRDPARVSRWVLASAIVGSAFAVGSVHTLTLCAVTAALATAAIGAWWNAEPLKMRPAATLLLATGCALTLYTALQCVPLPLRWLAAVAPYNADVWSRALTPLHERGPTWAPITLDPVATRVEVLKGVAYVLVLVTSLRLVRNRDGVRFLSLVIIGTGAVLAAAALLHPAFGMHKLFGVYEPSSAVALRHVAPLMNPNNLAGYLNIALCLAFAATIAPEPALPRAIGGAVVLLLGATQVWIASRGGVVAMGLGVLVVVALVRLVRTRRGTGIATVSLVTGVAVALGVVLIVLGGSENASSELLDADVSKLKNLTQVMRMFPAVPIFGCGRGAFESVFSNFRTMTGYVTQAYPENVAAQWILEWGLPFGVAGLAAVAFSLRPSAVLARSMTASGAWAAIVAVAVQNVGDLGTEVPGLMIAGTVCAAIVVGGAPGHNPRWRLENWSRSPKQVAVIVGVVGLVAIVIAMTGPRAEMNDDRNSQYEAVKRPHPSAAQMHAMARAAMLRHPAEPYLPFAVASRAMSSRDDNPMPWIGATVERSSVFGPVHLLLAQLVALRSPSQARMEYRLAMNQMPEAWGVAKEQLGPVVGGYDDATEVIPDGKLGLIVLESMISMLSDRLPATSERLDADLAARAPKDSGPTIRRAEGAVEDVEGAAPWCEGQLWSACVRDAVKNAQRAQRTAPADCSAYTLEARVRVADGDKAGGLAVVERAVDLVTDRVACLEALVEVAYSAGQGGRAELALEQILNAGCVEAAECTHNLRWVAQQEEAHGFSGKALGLYKRTLDASPDDEALLESVARLAAQAGLHAEAAEDYARLGRRHPEEVRWRLSEEIQRLEVTKAVIVP